MEDGDMLIDHMTFLLQKEAVLISLSNFSTSPWTGFILNLYLQATSRDMKIRRMPLRPFSFTQKSGPVTDRDRFDHDNRQQSAFRGILLPFEFFEFSGFVEFSLVLLVFFVIQQ